MQAAYLATTTYAVFGWWAIWTAWIQAFAWSCIGLL